MMAYKTKRVLFIENNERDIAVFERMVSVERLPYDYMIARSVNEALYYVSLPEQIDVIIVDYHLPDGTGFIVLEAVNDVPIIFMAAYDDQLIAVKAIKDGAADYIVKDQQSAYIAILPAAIEHVCLAWEHRNDVLDQPTLPENVVQQSIKAQTQVLFDNAQDAIILATFKGVILDCNRATLNLTGLSYQQLVGETFFKMKRVQIRKYNVSNPVDDNFNASGLLEYLMSNATDYEFILEDGTTKIVDMVIHPVVNDDQTLLMIVARDVTEQRHTALSLAKSEQRYQLIVELANEGLLLSDSDGLITYINPKWLTTLGYTLDEMLGRHYWDFLHPDYRASARQRFEQRKAGKGGRRDVQMERKNGTFVWMLVSSSPVFNVLGEFTGVLTMFTDISERKAYEETLQLALQHEKDLNDLKSRVIMTVSHEFRTPLAIIKSSIETIEHFSDKLTKQQIDSRIAAIKTQSNHLASMIDDILTLSEVGAGQIVFTPVEFDVSALCKQIVDEFKTTSGLQHYFNYVCESNPLNVFLDFKLIRQIMNNLISNAIKFSPEFTEITVELMRTDKHLVIHVTDHGIGIPEKDLSKLFTAFHRASNVGVIPGTRVGLALTRQLVALHEGYIDVKSRAPGGSVFTISIPLQRSSKIKSA